MTRFTAIYVIGFAAALGALCVLAQTPTSKPPSSSTKNAIGIEFLSIAPGEFTMGCSDGGSECTADEKPAHRVQITKPFEIGTYEVTQAQWQAVMGTNPSTIKGDNRPVETVTKDDAHQFLSKLNAQNDGYKYRLPTEAEWEYAARAGTGEPRPGELGQFAWYADNSDDETHPVGQKKPNAWGLYDMLGNVREWVEDQFAANYYSSSPAADPTGPAPGQGRGGRGFGRGPRGAPDQQFPPGGGGRGFGRGGFGGRGGPGGRQLPIARGGAWDNSASFVRLSARYHYYGPTLRVSDIGFRAVREPVKSE